MPLSLTFPYSFITIIFFYISVTFKQIHFVFLISQALGFADSIFFFFSGFVMADSLLRWIISPSGF